MRRSRLLSAEFSMNDVLYTPRPHKNISSKSHEQNAEESSTSSEVITPEKELFKGLSFKRLGSLEFIES